jgi:hypothetical protein
MPKFTKHIFICMNQREEGHPRGCCDPTGQGELQRLFKTKLAQRGVKMVRAKPGTEIFEYAGVEGDTAAKITAPAIINYSDTKKK